MVIGRKAERRRSKATGLEDHERINLIMAFMKSHSVFASRHEILQDALWTVF